MSDRRRVTGLDPKFTDILARMRGTTFEGERQAARNVGEAVAKRAGMTFDEAVAYSDDAGQSIDDLFRLWRTTQDDDERQAARRKIEIKAKRAGQTFKQAFDADQSKRWAAQKARGEPINPFVGLEDSMEADRPGYKAERARKAREEAEARAARRRAVLRRYGSEDAALAPCDRERKLLDAVKQWRVGRRPPYQRWTDNVDGWKDGWGKPPPHIDAAIRSAYPPPESNMTTGASDPRTLKRRSTGTATMSLILSPSPA